jgi:hypothetical protein
MFLFGLIAPTKSKQEVLNELITNNTMSVMATNSTTISSNIDSEFNFTVGAGGTVRGSTIKSTSSINVEALSNSKVNSKMQDELITKLKSELDKKRTDFPEFGRIDDQTIKNIITNNVNSSLTTESLINSNMTIKQRANITIAGDLINSEIIITNKGTMKLVNGMASDIIKDLGVTSETKNKSTAVTTSFLAEMTQTITDGVVNVADTIVTNVGDLFKLSPMMIIMFIVVVIVGYLLANKHLDNMPVSGSYTKQHSNYLPQHSGYNR